MITVDCHKTCEGVDISFTRIETLVLEICKQFGIEKAAINIVIIDDQEACTMNAKFLDRVGSTDCFSFDLSDEGAGERVFEVFVNGQRAAQEAGARKHRPEAELALYITHGLLHNLGYDDRTPALARAMHAMEDTILQRLGYGTVYNRT